jgi:hypothetical protein
MEEAKRSTWVKALSLRCSKYSAHMRWSKNDEPGDGVGYVKFTFSEGAGFMIDELLDRASNNNGEWIGI